MGDMAACTWGNIAVCVIVLGTVVTLLYVGLYTVLTTLQFQEGVALQDRTPRVVQDGQI
jgi:hypothetical protein